MKQTLYTDDFKQYKYECPHCDLHFPHWITKQSLSYKGFFIVCSYCGKAFKPVPPENEGFIISSTVELSTLAEKVVKVMVLSGYSKKEAESRVKRVYNEKKSIETLFKEAISL